MTDSKPGRETAISRDPIGVDPIGNDPLDFSTDVPKKSDGPNRTLGGWLATGTGVFTAVLVLAAIMVLIIVVLNLT